MVIFELTKFASENTIFIGEKLLNKIINFVFFLLISKGFRGKERSRSAMFSLGRS